MNTQQLAFLNEMGFSEIQINIYNYLLTNKLGTINDIKKKLNYSYTQVYHNLLFLKEKRLVESSDDSKPKLYFRNNPKIALTELLNKKLSNLKENIMTIDKELQIQESKFGRCVKDVSFYHYSNIKLSINNFHELLANTQKEIVISSLPPSLIKKIEPSLFEAFLRGIKIKLYFSNLDFNYYQNYFEKITDILKRIRVEIIQTEQKTCQVIKYNDEIVNMGNIILDDNYLNSVIFQEDDIYHVDGFKGPFAKSAKDYLTVLTVVKRMEIEYPEPIINVINAIEVNKSIMTRDIGMKAKIGGSKLKEIIEFLKNEGIIEEIEIKGDKGRPKKVYSLIN